MAKTTTELGDDGRPVTYKNTRARSRSEAPIPWTEGPGKSRRKRLARALWG